MKMTSHSVLHGALACALTCAGVSAAAGAQNAAPLVTKTIPLRHLRAIDAARLVSPYVRTAKGGVYDAGDGVQAVTVIETAPVVARIDSIIRANDRSPTVLVFRFQLIAADDTPARDPAIDSLEATLRSLFSYRGYHLLGQGTTTAGEGEGFSLTVAAGEERFGILGEVVRVQDGDRASGRAGNSPAGPLIVVDGAVANAEHAAAVANAQQAARDAGSTRVRVRLTRVSGGPSQTKGSDGETLLSTGLTVPIGQTVVLGSAAPGGRTQALILTVRPEVAIPSRR